MTAVHPTREVLLDAGVRVVEDRGLARATVDEITAVAGVAKGTFYIHFADRAAFLVALHGRFAATVGRALRDAAASLPPGRDRLLAGAGAYLDVCRAVPALKALVLESRSEPATHAAEAERNRRFALLAEEDFRALRWPQPDSAARLFVAMCAEAALIELESGRADGSARDALARFLHPDAERMESG